MRVIYQTLPVQASFTDPRTRRTITGYASFRVYLVGPDEEFPALPTIKHARSQFRRLADLRADAGHGKPIVAKMPARSALRGVLPDTITIPESVLESLPENAHLCFAWSFGSETGGPAL